MSFIGRDYKNDAEREQAQEERRAYRALALERSEHRVAELSAAMRELLDVMADIGTGSEDTKRLTDAVDRASAALERAQC